MDQRMLDWLEALSRALLWAGLAVFVLSLLGAIQIATSDNELPLLSEFQKESRAIAAFGTIAAGITSAGILAALGGILGLLLDARNRDTSA